MRKLKGTSNGLKQYARLLNLEVHALKECEREDLLLKLNKTGQPLCLENLNKHDVYGLQAFPSKPGKAPTVIIRFVSRTTRK